MHFEILLLGAHYGFKKSIVACKFPSLETESYFSLFWHYDTTSEQEESLNFNKSYFIVVSVFLGLKIIDVLNTIR